MTTLLHVLATDSAKHSALWRLRGKPCLVLVTLLLSTNVFCVTAQGQTLPPLVALASSFRGPWPELIQAYHSETGQAEPRTSFASSGLLTTQIRHGAPFELYLSADLSTVEQLQTLGKTRDGGIMLARGSLSLVWMNASQPSAGDSGLRGTTGTADKLNTGLNALALKQESGQTLKLAIPNPRHAPYGVAAKQALQAAGLWPLPPGNLLNAENAAQTLQFALSGAVDYAIIPDTLLLHAPDTLRHTPLHAGSYAAVVHQMVLLKPAGPDAQKLFDWLRGPTATTILTRYGLNPD